MLKKLVATLIWIAFLYVALFSPTALGDSAGYPTLLNPPILVTVSVSKTDVKPGDEITLDYYITNESEKALYICNAGFLTYDEVYEEKDWEYLDFDGEVIEPGKTIKISSEYITNPRTFSFEKDSVKCFIRPRIEYCYYTEKVKQGEFPRWYGMFEYNSNQSVVLTASPPYDFSSVLEIYYTAEKREDESIYDFYVTIQNHSDKTIDDLWIYSSLGQLKTADNDNEVPKSIKPNETLILHLIYDYEEKYYPGNYNQPNGNEFIALYVSGEYPDSGDTVYDISNNLQTLSFSTFELQLEAEILCDVKQAYYNEEIPCVLVLHNPTEKTYENIKIYGHDEAINILPGETKYIEDSDKEWFHGYGLSVYEGFDYKTLVNPHISLEYNGYTYSFDDWCLNYDEIEYPEVEIIMPPQMKNLINRIETSNSIEYIIYYENTNKENIAINIIGCVENGYLDDYVETVLFSDNNGWFSFAPGEYSNIVDDNGNMLLELIIVGYGEETNNMCWVHDAFPVTLVESTPEPTQTHFPAKAPTSTAEKEEPTAVSPVTSEPIPETMIELLSNANINSKTISILLTLNNITKKEMTDVKISDQNGNVLCELKKISSGQTYEKEFELKNENEIYLFVEYSQSGTIHTVKTGSILKLLPSEGETKSKSVALPIIAFAVFVALTIIIIIFIRKRNSRNKFT